MAPLASVLILGERRNQASVMIERSGNIAEGLTFRCQHEYREYQGGCAEHLNEEALWKARNVSRTLERLDMGLTWATFVPNPNLQLTLKGPGVKPSRIALQTEKREKSATWFVCVTLDIRCDDSSH